MAEQTQAVEQPAPESTESPDFDARMEALFGDGKKPKEQPSEQEPEAQTGEEVQASEESTETAEPELVDIDIDGETWQVPSKIKDRIMAEKDYTAKTTDLANTRRAIEAQQKEIALFNEQRAFEQSVAADVDQLKMLDAYIKHTKSVTDWTKLTTDQVVRAKLEMDQLVDQRNELFKALQAKGSEFEAKIKAERSKLKESAKEILSKAIPNWSDETRVAVEKYAQSAGYPEAAVQNMTALDAQVAWKAMQYDKLKAETKQAVKKAADAPVIAHTARKNPMPKQVRAKLDLKNAVKTGKKDVINVALDRRLGQIFGG